MYLYNTLCHTLKRNCVRPSDRTGTRTDTATTCTNGCHQSALRASAGQCHRTRTGPLRSTRVVITALFQSSGKEPDSEHQEDHVGPHEHIPTSPAPSPAALTVKRVSRGIPRSCVRLGDPVLPASRKRSRSPGVNWAASHTPRKTLDDSVLSARDVADQLGHARSDSSGSTRITLSDYASDPT
jgi:hypothetical protein